MMIGKAAGSLKYRYVTTQISQHQTPEDHYYHLLFRLMQCVSHFFARGTVFLVVKNRGTLREGRRLRAHVRCAGG